METARTLETHDDLLDLPEHARAELHAGALVLARIPAFAALELPAGQLCFPRLRT